MSGTRSQRQQGFTVIELLLGMVLAGILAAGILTFYLGSLNVTASQTVRMQNQDAARLAINQITRYLRMATSSADNQTSQSNAIAAANPQDIEFYCDLDGDSVADKVRYYLRSTTLLMQTAAPQWVQTPEPHWTYPEYQTDGVVVQNAVRNGSEPLFRYYRYGTAGLEQFAPGNAADRQQIVVVGIDLRINEVPQLARTDVRSSTQVQLRQRYEGGLQ